MAHLQLGRVCTDRQRGQPTRNYRRALYHFECAKKIFSRERYPSQWANVQVLCGKTLVGCPWLTEVRRRLLSIRCFEETLQVRTERRNPTLWAESQLNLAMNYYQLFFARGRDQPRRYDSRDMEMAWGHIQKALGVYRRGIGSRRVLKRAQELQGWITKVLHSKGFSALKRLRTRR